MNEAGLSNQDHSQNDAQTATQARETGTVEDRAEGAVRSTPSQTLPPAPALPVTVHPLAWAIQLWVVATVTSLLLSGGLTSALRGAYVGAESTIVVLDHASALTSQVAAICTTLLLIYVGLMSARASSSLTLGVGSALLGAVPTLLVFYAHRFSLPHIYTWMSALCAGGTLLLSATQARNSGPVRAVLALASLTMLSAVLRTYQLFDSSSPILSRLGSGLQLSFAWLTIVTATILHLSSPNWKPLRGALLLGLALLLAQTTSASTQPGAPRWILLSGRALSELTSGSQMGAGGSLAFSLSILLLFSAVVSRPNSFSHVLCGVLALCVTVPFSPLTIATMTLCGYCAVVIFWVPRDARVSTSR